MIATRDEVQSLARHALTGVGLVLVRFGVGDAAIVESLAGVAFIVAGLVWSVLDKRQKRKQLAAAKAEMPPIEADHVLCSVCDPPHRIAAAEVRGMVPWCGKERA